MIVTKFGGTSVASAARIETLCLIVADRIDRQPVVVVSALSKVTDLILSLLESPPSQANLKLRKIRKTHIDEVGKLFHDKKTHDEMERYVNERLKVLEGLVRRPRSKARQDAAAAQGEILSSAIIAQALRTKGVAAQQVIATELIVTDDNHTAAEFLHTETRANVQQKLGPLLNKNIVPVVTGFIGATKKGAITTLGRGGSDYTASIIGFCLKAEEIQIWTDVDGVYTTDPRMVKRARLLPAISFREASEIAAFGGKVLHPRTIKPAIAAHIPVRVLSSFNPRGMGTLITASPQVHGPVVAVSCKRKVTLVNIYSTDMLLKKGFLAGIFEVFARHNISIDLVSVSEVSISVTLDNDENLSLVTADLGKYTSVSITKNLGMVSLIGEGIVNSSSRIKNIFDILDRKKIAVKMISLGATDINVSLVIPSDRVEEAVTEFHNKILLPSLKQT